MTDRLDQLAEVAVQLGIQTSYWDAQGREHHATAEALAAVLRARGAPLDDGSDLADLHHHVRRRALRAVPPVVIVWDDRAIGFDLCLPDAVADQDVRVEVHLENGGMRLYAFRPEAIAATRHEGDGETSWSGRWVELEGALPTGYHTLIVVADGEQHTATVIAAPTRLVEPAAAERTWGVFAPLYSLRSERGLGPDLGDLEALGEWAHGLGGRIIATLPVLAAYLDDPFDPSPYAPVSRRFWNELYLDVERLPELADSPAARAFLAAASTRAEVAALRDLDDFDYRRHADLVGQAVRELSRSFFAGNGPDSDQFRRFTAERPDALDYAQFRAEVARQGVGWHGWPDETRSGALDVDALDPDVVHHHLYAQFAMHRQMDEVRVGLDAREQRLYLDLPVGAHGDGYDTWRERHLFAWGMSTGAPPDDFFTGGQSWGFPPIDPDASREQGHRHVAECLRHHMRAARVLRLDHVMQLHRLFWVPDHLGPSEGVYVTYPREELLAVVSVEAHRSGCVVVGEDLGTVPDEIRDAMAHHGMLGTHVAEFQMPGWYGAAPGRPPHLSVASIDTHDTPTFSAFVRGLDIGDRLASGLIDADEAREERHRRLEAVDHLRAHLIEHQGLDPAGDEHDLLRAVLQFLGDSDAAMVLVSLDDLWAETNPQNVPGTGIDRPNWVQRMVDTLDQLKVDEEVIADLTLLQQARLSSYDRSRQDDR